MAAPLPQDGLASQLPSDLFDEVLKQAHVPTLLKIKGVSRSWRAGARRVLRSRLCRHEGQPVPTSRADAVGLEAAKPLSSLRVRSNKSEAHTWGVERRFG